MTFFQTEVKNKWNFFGLCSRNIFWCFASKTWESGMSWLELWQMKCSVFLRARNSMGEVKSRHYYAPNFCPKRNPDGLQIFWSLMELYKGTFWEIDDVGGWVQTIFYLSICPLILTSRHIIKKDLSNWPPPPPSLL